MKHSTHVIELPELKPHPVPGAPILGASANALQNVKVRVRVVAGEASITVSELMALREDAILGLDRPVDDPVDIVLDGQVVARGQLVAVDDDFGVRITEVCKTAKP